ncbi:MAG: TIGR03643 family protein [Saprospiraceae bacterium]
MKIIEKYNLSEQNIDRIIEMAWEDRTPFDAIQNQFGLPEGDVIKLMKNQMKLSSWKRWRARVQGRSTKHRQLRSEEVGRFRCSRQKQISYNNLSKRK